MVSPLDLPFAAPCLAALQAAAPLDLLVGVHAADGASGALELLEAAGAALAQRFPSRRTAVLAVPAGTRAAAAEAIRSWATAATAAGRLCLEPARLMDDGEALRALLAAAGRLEVGGALIMDASLGGLRPEALAAWLEPVATGQADCALPAYTRSLADGTLTTNLLSPLVRALYAREVQQVVGGGAAVSKSLLADLLGAASWAEGWPAPGTEIWLVTRALGGARRVVQVHLGRRPARPAPANDLPGIVAGAVGPLFTLMDRDGEIWREPRGVEKTPLLGGPAETLPDPGGAAVERMVRAFRLGLKDLLPVWEQIMPETTLGDLYPLVLPPVEDFRFAPRVWARVVLDFAVAHHERRLPEDHLLRALVPLYLGRTAAFLIETRRSPSAERVVEEIALAFEAERPTLVGRWR